ncbi:MAG TPA: 3-isopropylmalate dehydratase large subunit [Anaerolineae bacterium]|nr:3-isopropylmalate dehydratase large subunit [Anaerolineae bacterium]HQH38698.1 3-isopropylmalate dehydratase large subunit [Anaerolineae bacterium]
MGLTCAEKVLARKAGLESVVAGQIVTVRPDKLLTHDNTSDIARKFHAIGVAQVAHPAMHVIVLDHVTPAANETYAASHRATRAFVAEQGIAAFYDIGEGICHQVLPEKGHAWPGALIVGSDSHTPTHGAFGAFAAGIGRTEAAAVMATGAIWLRVPETLRLVLHGTLPPRVSAKDVILRLIGDLHADGADYCSVEFAGEAVRAMSVAGRMVLCNMAAEMGAKNAIVEADTTTLTWLAGRTPWDSATLRRWAAEFRADPDAAYARVIDYDVSELAPQIAKPHTVDNVVPVTEVVGTKIDQALIGTCTNGRLEDLEVAADILRGKHIAPGVRLLVLPASREVLLAALSRGVIADLVAAGATLLNPGCGPCLGAHEGCMAPGEVTLSTANRNFKGRMGSKEAFTYLGSPATVAASALAGVIVDARTA